MNGASAHLGSISGSVEIMVSLGVADPVVDPVETGSTVEANRLRALDEIGRHETVLIQGRACRETDLADRIVRRIEGVVIARSDSLVAYDVPRAQLSDAEAIPPGFSSPTVNALEDAAWCSVRVMVARADGIDVIERLEVLGAQAILETPINDCRL